MNGNILLAQASLVVLAFSTLLSFKSRRLAVWCGGLSHQLRLHHILATVGSLLAGSHVLVEALDFFRMDVLFDLETWLDAGMASGLAAAAGLVGLVLLAWVQQWGHRVWLALHRGMLAVVLLAALHGLFMNHVQGQYQGSVLTLGVLALAACAVLVLGVGVFWVPSQQTFKIVSIHEIFPGFMELRVDPKAVTYPAGSVVYVRFVGREWTRSWHPLSVASCRYEGQLRLLVRMCGRDTMQMHKLQPGDVVKVRGPYVDLLPQAFEGQTVASESGAGPLVDEVWLAAGVGVAPFVGFLHCAHVLRLGRVCLVHFDRDAHESEAVQRLCEGLVAAGSQTPGGPTIQVRAARKSLHLASEAEIIVDLAREFPAARFLVCGSPDFMKAARRLLRGGGVPGKRIITEELMR
jgi:predicted ferric reductase